MNSLDKRQVARAFVRAVECKLFQEVAARLEERLDEIALSPRMVADIGGPGAPLLRRRYPGSRLLALDLAAAVLLRGRADWRIRADAEQLPLADGVVDLLWSNLCYEWTNPAAAFGEAARVTKAGGLMIFSTLGRDTLKEVRAATMCIGGDRVHVFCDMHDLGDMLLAAGFAEPVMQTDTVSLTYACAADALREVHDSGGGCALQARESGLLGKDKWRRLLECYRQTFGDENGRVTATYEIIYGLAWRRDAAPAAGESPLRFHR